jgi:coatomer subunit beta'
MGSESADDMMIKSWDWDSGWKCTMDFERYACTLLYIMNLSINLKDPASLCLDRTVKIWSLTNLIPNFTLKAHDRGVNYSMSRSTRNPCPDKPYLLITGDDRSLKIWVYLSKSCVRTPEGHGLSVTASAFHPVHPLIISGSEDGTVNVWNSGTWLKVHLRFSPVLN